jgi:hypothetical protein
MECWRKKIQDNFQVMLEDDDSEHLLASTFVDQINIHSEN